MVGYLDQAYLNPMAEKYITAIVSILVAIVGVAFLAVLVSKQSNTTGVATAGAQGFAQMICTALSPVTGASCGGAGIPNVNSTITFGGQPGGGGGFPFFGGRPL
jgi:hypothetical protein